MRKTSILIILVLAVSSMTIVLSPVAEDVGIPSIFPSIDPGPALTTFRNLTVPLSSPGEVCCWEAQSLYATTSGFSGYLTVGGNGYVVDSLDLLATPFVSSSGYLTGTAWGHNEFLLVGSHYGPSGGVIMYTYNPSTNTITNLTSIFGGAMAHHASLVDVQWSGSRFFILGIAGFNIAPNARVFVFDPVKLTLTNLTSTIPTSFRNLGGGMQQMVWTPKGLFFLLTTPTGLKFGLLKGVTFTDLSSSLPIGLFVPFCNGTICGYFGNMMQWDPANHLLFIAGFLKSHHIAFFSFNPKTNVMQNLSSKFVSFSSTVDILYLYNGNLYLGGGSGVNFGPPPYTPFLAVMDTSTLAVTDLSYLIPSSFQAVSSVATDGTSVFLGGGVLYHSQYGILSP